MLELLQLLGNELQDLLNLLELLEQDLLQVLHLLNLMRHGLQELDDLRQHLLQLNATNALAQHPVQWLRRERICLCEQLRLRERQPERSDVESAISPWRLLLRERINRTKSKRSHVTSSGESSPIVVSANARPTPVRPARKCVSPCVR